MKEHLCRPMTNPSKKYWSMFLAAMSIPWCCVISISFALISTSGSLLGVIFDGWFHKWMPIIVVLLVPVHLYGVCSYATHRHKNRSQTLFFLATSTLFVLSIWFHFTGVHDYLIHNRRH